MCACLCVDADLSTARGMRYYPNNFVTGQFELKQRGSPKPQVCYLSFLFEKISPAPDSNTELDIGKNLSLKSELTNVSLLLSQCT